MFEIFYKALFCGGPLNGRTKVFRAVNGIMIDRVGESVPGPNGFEEALYARDGFPDNEGIVKYVFEPELIDKGSH